MPGVNEGAIADAVRDANASVRYADAALARIIAAHDGGMAELFALQRVSAYLANARSAHVRLFVALGETDG